jgi:hypothetical protein
MLGRGNEFPHSWQKRAMGLPGPLLGGFPAVSGGQRTAGAALGVVAARAAEAALLG